VKLGHSCFVTPAGLRPDVLAVALEQRGFESLWLGEHTHIPVGDRLPPSRSFTTLPDAYTSMPDPLVSLAVASAATTTLRLGTSVALVLEHEPIAYAKAVATLDVLCEGRLLLGVGVGWHREELANISPVPWSRRYDALEERVAVLRALWTQDTPAFDGEFTRFGPIRSWPKPHRPGGPPVLAGLSGPLGLQHAARWADGWFPIGRTLADLEASVAAFREAAAAAGRSSTVDVSMTLPFAADPDAASASFDRLRHARDLGVVRVVLVDDPARVPAVDERMRILDRYASVVAELDAEEAHDADPADR
jgi:probable F420-dependent oxidoreductase